MAMTIGDAAAAEVQPGTYDHRTAWSLGTLVFGLAIAAIALGGAVVLRVEPWMVPSEDRVDRLPIAGDGWSGLQVLGVLTLLAAGCLLALGKAAQQMRGRLPQSLLVIVIDPLHDALTGVASYLKVVPGEIWRVVRRLPAPEAEGSSSADDRPLSTDDVASVPVATVAIVVGVGVAGVGATWVAGLGIAGMFAGLGVAGAATALAGLLSSSRAILGHVVALLTSIVVIGCSADIDSGERASVIVLGTIWTLLAWTTIVRARLGKRSALMGTVAGLAIAAGILNEIDNTLGSLTSPGRSPRGFGDLAPVSDPGGVIDRVSEAGSTWRSFRAAAAPTDVVPLDHALRLTYVIVDSAVLAVAYPLLLFVAARAIARRLGNEERASMLKSILTVTQFAMPILMVVDIAENFTGSAAVQHITGTASDRADLADAFELLAVAHWAAAALKWLTLVGAVVAVVAGIGWVVTRPRTEIVLDPDRSPVPDGGPIADVPSRAVRIVRGNAHQWYRRPVEDRLVAPAVRPDRAWIHRWNEPYESLAGRALPTTTASARAVLSAIVLLRAYVAIVLIVVLALRNQQTYDAIRVIVDHGTAQGDTSTVSAVQAFLLVVLALAAGLAIRFMADLLVRQLRGGAESSAPGRIGHGIIVLSFALVFLVFLDSPGFFIGVALYLALEVLSRPLREQPERSTTDRVGGWFRSTMRSIRDALREFGTIGALSVALAGGLFVAAWIAHRSSEGPDAVRWVIVVAAGLLVIHAIGQIALPDLNLGATSRRRRRSGDDTVAATTADGAVASGPAVVAPVVAPSPTQAYQEQQAAIRREFERGVRTNRDREFVQAVRVIGHVLGALVPIVIGAAVVRSSLGLIIYGDVVFTRDNQGDWILLCIGVALALLGVIIQSQLQLAWLPTWPQASSIAAVRLLLAGVVALYVIAWQTIRIPGVINLTRDLGAIGVLLVFVLLLVSIATAITYLSAETNALAALRLVGFRRPPFFLLGFVWLMIASVIDGGGYHNVPIRDAATPFTYERDGDAVAVSLRPEDALETWMSECAGEDATREAVPMVFVAASGGGIRAAYWTASALEQLDELVGDRFGPTCNPIFVASGASGGSLGLSVYTVDRLANPDQTPETTTERLDGDYLAPPLSWFLFADFVRPFVLWDDDGNSTIDRGEMLEEAWSPRADPTRDETERPITRCEIAPGGSVPADVTLRSGLRETWCLGAPLLILNGSEANSGCRFIASVLDNGDPDVHDDPSPGDCLRPRGTDEVPDSGPLGATIDLVDSLCPDQDISLATAALLSARFPFVSPSGRVPDVTCPGESEDALAGSLDDDPAFVVDGGYIDNSGASSAVQLWSDISTRIDRHNALRVGVDPADAPAGPCIVPIFLQLDNGYEFDAATVSNRPLELVVPLTAAVASRGSREAEAKQVAAEVFFPSVFSGATEAVVTGSEQEPLNRWFRVSPKAHPGIQAPLGWVLSDLAQADLDSELDAQLAPDGQLGLLADVLTSDLTCQPSPEPTG